MSLLGGRARKAVTLPDDGPLRLQTEGIELTNPDGNQWPDVLASMQSYSRFIERGAQARGLNAWSLNRRVPDEGSSLHQDDLVCHELLGLELGDPLICSGTAIFPAMAAVDNIVAVSKLHEQLDRAKIRLWVPSTLNLCRTALESASRTIWLLSPVERSARRARTLALAGKEWYEQRQYFELDGSPARTAAEARSREAHREHSDARREVAELITSRLPKEHSFLKPIPLIQFASNWIDENPPSHRKSELLRNSLQPSLPSMYSLESSTVHGYKWAHELLSDSGGNLIGMIADALYASVVVTEAAVCLYESQALGPTRAQSTTYPKTLWPTVKRWTRRYRI